LAKIAGAIDPIEKEKEWKVKCMYLEKYKIFELVLILITAALLFFPLTGAAVERVTDRTISDAVEDEILLDPAVSHERIDVGTDEGIVTLTGSVDNLLAKERAARIAETVKGVRAVVNRINVLPPLLKTDSEIKDDALYALNNDSATESFEIKLSVDDGEVILTGTVDSWPERTLAEKVVKGVSGVRGVRNELMVDYRDSRPDDQIKAEILRRVPEWESGFTGRWKRSRSRCRSA